MESTWQISLSDNYMYTCKLDAEEVCGVRQLCAGTGSGIKNVVHALNELFDENHLNGWGYLWWMLRMPLTR